MYNNKSSIENNIYDIEYLNVCKVWNDKRRRVFED